jgi:two-component system sensor histidine kinase PhoQ
MRKVYADKSLRIDVDVPERVMFRGDSGDLLEIVGNLCDNACKWANAQVRVTANNIESSEGTLLILTIADDGPGIPEAMTEKVTARGVRADSTRDGQGIGLATVKDMVEIYGGELRIQTGALGGAEVSITL